MEKEYIGVTGYKAIVDETKNTFFIKSNICKENCFLPHIEYVDLSNVNLQGRGTLTIFTDAQSPLHIVFKKTQNDEITELYNILTSYHQQLSLGSNFFNLYMFFFKIFFNFLRNSLICINT